MVTRFNFYCTTLFPPLAVTGGRWLDGWRSLCNTYHKHMSLDISTKKYRRLLGTHPTLALCGSVTLSRLGCLSCSNDDVVVCVRTRFAQVSDSYLGHPSCFLGKLVILSRRQLVAVLVSCLTLPSRSVIPSPCCSAFVVLPWQRHTTPRRHGQFFLGGLKLRCTRLIENKEYTLLHLISSEQYTTIGLNDAEARSHTLTTVVFLAQENFLIVR